MKKINYLLPIIIFFYTSITLAQIPPEFNCECSMCCDPPAEESFSCNNTSPYWSDNSLYLPDLSDNDIFVRINLIFLNQDDGTGGIQEGDPEHDEIFDEAIDVLNDKYNNLVNPGSDPNCYIPNGFLSSSRIQFVYNKVYINDTYFWNNDNDTYPFCPSSTWYMNALDDQIVNDPDIPKGINIYFTESEVYYYALVIDQTTQDPPPYGIACSEWPSTSDLDKSSRISMPFLFTKMYYMREYATEIYNEPWDPVVRGWYINGLGSALAHELGHSFALGHIYDCDWSIMNPAGDAYRKQFRPEEIGKMHRYMAISNIRKLATNDSRFTTPRIITNNELWDLDFTVYSDIEIDPGVTLTISCKLVMKHENKIIIKPGGTLVVDGGTITTEDNYKWQGIQVWGDPMSSNPIDQGRLFVHNESTIENATIAVQNFQPTIPLNNNKGGLVEITNSTFTNNEIAFSLDSPNYGSWIDDCEFITDENFLGEEFDTFIKLITIDDMSIHDCSFTNSDTDYEGYGIKASNASFVLNGGNTSFDNLLYGVYAVGYGTTEFSRIEEGIFTNNYRGVYISSINEMVITDNEFSIPPNDPFIIGGDESHGVYLDECTGFTIEENDFFTYGGGIKGTVGLYIYESGPNDNMVYHNTFDNLIYGTIAYGQNKSTSIGTKAKGLCYKCNTFTNNDYDISIPMSPTTGSGIKPIQGSSGPNTDDPAGNLFSWEGPLGTPTDINNLGGLITYYYHGNEPLIPLEPKYYTATTPVPNYVVWNEELSCPESTGNGGGGGIGGGRDALTGEIDDNETEAANIQVTLNMIVDGGDTEATEQNVATSYPPESYEVYNDLMNKSPYLSKGVVDASIEKDDVLPNVMIRDVMVANPQSAKEDDLVNKLDERSEPLPDYMLAQILQGRSLVGYMEELYSQKSYYEQKRTLAFNSLLRVILEDEELTVEQRTDELIALFLNENTLTAQYRLAMLYFEKVEFASGQNILNNIPSNFQLSDEQITAHDYFNDFYQIIIDIAQSGEGLSEAQVSELQGIEQAEIDLASAFSRNLLIANNEMEYIEPVILPDFSKSAEAEQEYNDLMQTLEDHHYLKLFPNPATDYVVIEYELEMEYSNAEIKLYNNKGILLQTLQANNIKNQKVIDTNDLPTGVYIVSLFINNNEMDSIKFTIVK